MAAFCAGPACGMPFDSLNRIFKDGVDPDIANVMSFRVPKTVEDTNKAGQGVVDQDSLDHYRADWLGIDGNAWFGPEAGELLWKAFVDVIKRAGKRQVKALWSEGSEVAVQVIEDDRLVLVIVTSPRPDAQVGDKPHFASPCGHVHSVTDYQN